MVSPKFEDQTSDQPSVILRIQGIGSVPVEQIQSFLGRLSWAYNSIYVFDSIVSQWKAEEARVREIERDFFYPEYRRLKHWDFLPRRLPDILGMPFDQVDQMVPVDSQLFLNRVSLNSPGFWEFLGKLNPLEVIRLGLNDRHERRKDREYREKHENEKLMLENALLQSKVYASQVEVLKELGMSNEEMTVLKNRLIHTPFNALTATQDHNLIGSAEFVLPQRKPNQ